LIRVNEYPLCLYLFGLIFIIIFLSLTTKESLTNLDHFPLKFFPDEEGPFIEPAGGWTISTCISMSWPFSAASPSSYSSLMSQPLVESAGLNST
jgi:hypothetical protein